MTTHELKIYPTFFVMILVGTKRFEYRKYTGGPGYSVGDTLLLRECREGEKPTGRALSCTVTCTLHGPNMGIPAGYVIMSISNITPQPTLPKAENLQE